MRDTCPADAHLAAFAAAEIERVLVVVSPDAEAVARHVEPWRDRLDVSLVVNEHAADRNNWYSLLVGLGAWNTGRDDVVVVNSDLYADPRWFIDLLHGICRARAGAALAVDPARGRTDEAMKVAQDDGDRVTAIGKVGVDQPAGEYVGLARWSAPEAAALRAVLAGFEDDPLRVDCWYEHAIHAHIEAGGDYRAVEVPSSSWVEIDDERDLRAARRLAVGR